MVGSGVVEHDDLVLVVDIVDLVEVVRSHSIWAVVALMVDMVVEVIVVEYLVICVFRCDSVVPGALELVDVPHDAFRSG